MVSVFVARSCQDEGDGVDGSAESGDDSDDSDSTFSGQEEAIAVLENVEERALPVIGVLLNAHCTA